jgi:iron(III) transport system substrate-binding protein
MRALLALGLFALSCGPSAPHVAVYASVDQIYALEVFQAFTRETGIAVRPVFDAEENKTLGLVHRLVAEKGSPRADVFWSGEAARTALLKEKGVLEPYRSPAAADIAAGWRDPDGAWTGFAARARVIVYHTKSVQDPPRTFEALADPGWKVAIANPAFGTTAAHVAALAQARGEEPTLRWLAALKANGARVVGGNSHVRDLVARGDCAVGLTDSDDVWVGKDRGDPIEMLVPEDALHIPNTVALVRGAPRPDAATRFIDFLLRPETERLLARGRSRQIPVRGLKPPAVDWPRLATSEAFLEKAGKALDL